ncbi:hypothetical protein L1987_37188 [Smallanthus sonchifolius]|uniref:Uncharacterized protein n=1 Tax=Smallanthus sonchifolius TaxID=185202 RepID=A0ACB9HGB9_9ASTR|nr:hypothetical protein L1987_37188 [Smallanthus sonchifolius]
MFSRDRKIKILQKFASKLYSLQSEGRVQKVQPIMGAKVPILKFVDTATRVECDLSVENWDGLSKSWVIRFITSIDERFMKLSFLIKAWAKAHDINSPKDQTLNSISIILLVAFHLQTRDPPILPPFSAILEDGEDLASVRNSVRNFQNYGRRNSETLGELFVSFLIMLASVEDLWQKGLCASPYLGKWTSKTWDNKIAIMSVEDFMDQTQNVARTVGKLEVKRIYNRIHLTIEDLGLFMKVKIDGLQLKESIFGGPEISWARNLVYHQSMMGRRVVEGVSSTQRQGSTLGRPGWTQGTQSLGGGASTSSWGGASGAAFTDNHNRSSQEMQPATNPEEEGPEEEGFINLLMMTAKFIAILGNSSNTHGPPSR